MARAGRGDRPVRMAASRARVVRQGLVYDVEVDSTHSSPLGQAGPERQRGCDCGGTPATLVASTASKHCKFVDERGVSDHNDIAVC